MYWTNELVPGDKIIAMARGHKYLCEVKHIDVNFVTLTNGNIFRKRNGYLIGKTYNNNLRIMRPCKAEIEKLAHAIERKELVSAIKSIHLRKLTNKQLAEIVASIDCLAQEGVKSDVK